MTYSSSGGKFLVLQPDVNAYSGPGGWSCYDGSSTPTDKIDDYSACPTGEWTNNGASSGMVSCGSPSSPVDGGVIALAAAGGVLAFALVILAVVCYFMKKKKKTEKKDDAGVEATPTAVQVATPLPL